MRRLLIAVTFLLAVAPAFLIALLPAYADPKNYGKADDYGSERYAMVSHCMVEAIKHKEPGKAAAPNSIPDCMHDNGFHFAPNNRVFGNQGEQCKDGDPLHSWCWERD